MATEAEHAVVE